MRILSLFSLTSLRMELEEMKKQLHEKSSRSIIDNSPSNLTQRESYPTSFDKDKTSLNGGHGSRIPGAAMNSTNSLVEPQMDDLQAANCVIS